jgi:hypothetical protein
LLGNRRRCFACRENLQDGQATSKLNRGKTPSTQGQRVLTVSPGKDFGHEIEIPAATAALHGDAVLAGVLLQ